MIFDQLFIIFLIYRYYVCFLPFFREAFTLKTVPKENLHWFWNWRFAYFYHTDRYFIEFINLISIQWPCNLYNIIWTNFKSRQTFLGFETYICWDRTVAVYCRALLTKLKYSLNKLAFTTKSETSWLPTNNGGISRILVPFAIVFSIFQLVFGAALG